VGNSTTYSPWILDPANPGDAATTGDNIRDNVEQVHIASPVAGWYAVRITHKGTLVGSSQAVSLIISGPPIPIVANVKAFLQGSYDSLSAAMTTTLRSSGYLPTHHPYGVPPWNYLGTDSVASIPAGVVDWVLVELRTGPDSASAVSSRAAFIKSDGTVVDTSSAGPVKFSTVAAGNYYIVLRHRNHLAIMSAATAALSASSTVYDFSTSQGKAYGTDAMKQVSTGIYGMYGGEANGDGQITSSDFNVFLPKFTSGAGGYDLSDWNLDGYVTSSDFNFFLANFTAGKASRVP